MSFLVLLVSKPPKQREQNSRYASHNGVRFFADCAAKKGPPFGAVELKPRGKLAFGGTPENMLSSQACLSH